MSWLIVSCMKLEEEFVDKSQRFQKQIVTNKLSLLEISY